MKTTDVRVRRAIAAVRAGKPVVITDDDADGYLAFAADAANTSLLAFTIRHSSGYVRTALPPQECARLNLPPMCGGDSPDRVSVDCHGTGTGISASDRAMTIAALASARSTTSDFHRPGHVVPVQVESDGVLRRAGAAEAAVDLARLAGRRPAAALSAIVSRHDPVLMARGAELAEFAVEYGIAIVAVAELVAYRRRTEPSLLRLTDTTLPTWAGDSRVIGFRDIHDGGEHLAMIVGRPGAGVPVPLHVHVECLTGDVFGSTACRCGDELAGALAEMSARGSGVVLYLRPSGSPRACGLFAESPVLGAPASQTAAWMLRELGVYAIKLSDDLTGFGLVMFGEIREHAMNTPALAVAV